MAGVCEPDRDFVNGVLNSLFFTSIAWFIFKTKLDYIMKFKYRFYKSELESLIFHVEIRLLITIYTNV